MAVGDKIFLASKSQVDNVQAQVDELVVNGDSSPAAAQAQVGSDGTLYGSLKTRLDVEYQKHSSELAQKATKAELVGVASPLARSLVADFTDTSRIYVYTGSESGYTKGNWYSWNGSAWTSGGIYQSDIIQVYGKKEYTLQDGYYDVSGPLTVTTAYKSLKSACTPGETLRCKTTISGSAMAMAQFYKSDGSYISLSFINRGTNGVDTTYTDYEFTAPANAYFVAVSGKASGVVKLEGKITVQSSVKMDDLETRTVSLESDISVLNSISNYWKGKKIVWFGTSIPAGTATGLYKYPQMIGQLLGATVYNEAQGSSMARNGKTSLRTADDPYGWTGLDWQNVAYSLSATLVEKQYLINNWATWKTKLVGSPPDTLSTTLQDAIKDFSYENRLVARHLGANRADLYVFDHGHNDNLSIDSGADLSTLPADTRDRGYFHGAINYLIDLILTDNPRARICFIGHYENARKSVVSQAQTVVAEYWDFPFCKLWEKLGWTQQTVQTTGYWGADGIWVESGGTLQTYTMTQIWMKDNLHPHSDLSGKAITLYAETLAQFIDSVR